MALDYSERRQVNNNRPKKQPVGLFVFLIVGGLTTSFGLGLLTGWLVFKPARQTVAASDILQGERNAPAASLPRQQAPATAPRTNEPPLTFYDTLSKGNKAIIGTGLNPKRPDDPRIPKSPPPPPLPVQQPQKVEKAEKTEPPAVPNPIEKSAGEPKEAERRVTSEAGKESAEKKSGHAGNTYSVQIASFQDRKEAEAVRAKVGAKGMAAYIVESNLPGKGVWYRVRVGRHLGQQAANELATKVGRGAIVLPE